MIRVTFFVFCAKLVGSYQSSFTGKFRGLLIENLDSFLTGIFITFCKCTKNSIVHLLTGNSTFFTYM